MEVLHGDLTAEWYQTLSFNDYIGVDIETSGLDRQLDRIACIQFYGISGGPVLVRNLSNNPHHLISLLSTRKTGKIFHYASFDLTFLMRDYSWLQPKYILDTKIAAKLLDPHKQRFYDPKGRNNHSLNALLYTAFGIRLDKSTALSNWFNKEYTPEQLLYAEGDVKDLIQLHDFLLVDLRRMDLQYDYEMACQYLPTKIRLELLGYNDIYGYE